MQRLPVGLATALVRLSAVVFDDEEHTVSGL